MKCKEFLVLSCSRSLIPHEAAGIALAMHFQEGERSGVATTLQIFPPVLIKTFSSVASLQFAPKVHPDLRLPASLLTGRTIRHLPPHSPLKMRIASSTAPTIARQEIVAEATPSRFPEGLSFLRMKGPVFPRNWARNC